ncbi:monofunctional biosynthetic peptidoglycan transglycosylase [Roseicella frigidaeris]|uniref:Biosynthetic peptidoglycan transglycosylase n=1 Tax=Roseicella frigidaeris TaxID=2230885 RepID=A0A327M838_9PROT|nr:monofunctional biosynthetic peptidoglycan transglycosylase [Roseicella frigidaeris]RAI58482.1 monofunctional biosynthetic peptidoglycan transglycosylase [Roseicella frigidaeris]
MRLRPALPRSLGRLLRILALALLLGPPGLILVVRVLPPPATPLMLIRLVQGHGLHKDWVPYAAIAPALPDAVIAAEDNLFCTEALGFDLAALRGQVAAWWRGERPRGASTLTMQTAKNLLLWPGRDPLRKLAEAWLTPQIALLWPKRRVLEVYLNIVEFGPGLYGAEAAAQAFFGKPARLLTRHEAARLAAVLPSPLRWSVAAPDAALRARTALIERRVPQLGPLLDCAR